MQEAELLAFAPSTQKLIDWFGFLPSFHDAEIVSIELHRLGPSFVRVHTFRSLSETNESGHYKTDRHAIVSIVVDAISDMQLLGFSHQNVISDIVFEKTADGIKMILGGCFGVEGYIIAGGFAFEINAGIPPASIYETAS